MNNLQWTRKPAFQRTEVPAKLSDWEEYVECIREGAAHIERVRRDGTGAQGGALHVPIPGNVLREND